MRLLSNIPFILQLKANYFDFPNQYFNTVTGKYYIINIFSSRCAIAVAKCIEDCCEGSCLSDGKCIG